MIVFIKLLIVNVLFLFPIFTLLAIGMLIKPEVGFQKLMPGRILKCGSWRKMCTAAGHGS